MIQTVKHIIADKFISWAIELYDGDIKISLCQWVLNNFPTEIKEKKEQGLI